MTSAANRGCCTYVNKSFLALRSRFVHQNLTIHGNAGCGLVCIVMHMGAAVLFLNYATK